LKQSKAISGEFDVAAEYPSVDTLDRYLEALASAEPTPGGGSAATIVAALGSALVAMVARISAGNPAYADRAAEATALAGEADALRAELLEARTRDERAYARVVGAMALPKNSVAEKSLRTEQVQAALAGAAAEPLHAAELALGVLSLARRAEALGNRNLESDVACASTFARAALAASAANVRVNHAYLKDPELVDAQERALRALEAAASGDGTL
jgi:formiminotetrahydrofolate cyclodeaminase